MKVVLLMDVKGHGKKGDVVEASDGYARNFLLPKKMAEIALLSAEKSCVPYEIGNAQIALSLVNFILV